MDSATPHTHPVQSIFGAGFIPELHIDDDQRNLGPVEEELRLTDFISLLRGLVRSGDR